MWVSLPYLASLSAKCERKRKGWEKLLIERDVLAKIGVLPLREVGLTPKKRRA